MKKLVDFAAVELSKDPRRGICTITWKGGAAALVLDTMRPVIEAWDCFEAGYSTVTLVYTPTIKILVGGLNALCPSNPAKASCAWSALKATLEEAVMKIKGVTEVSIVETGYLGL